MWRVGSETDAAVRLALPRSSGIPRVPELISLARVPSAAAWGGDPSQEAMADERHGRVLSIQSHVVRGYVGNKSAVFPLQLLGLDVDIINSVHFSNHTGYPSWGGNHLRLTGDDLHALLDGLVANDLLQDAHSHLLLGYVGSVTLLDAIVRVHDRLKAAQSHPERFTFVCDPVMGDLGKLYVPKEVVDGYRSKVVPIADVLTPNQFECEQLVERPLKTVADALQACKQLHRMGPKVVVISSFIETTAQSEDKPSELVVIGSQVVSESLCEQYELRVPWIDSYYTGTGDLFAALLLAWLNRLPHDFQRVLENVLSTIQDVLKITLELGGRNCDLKLIQSRHVIADPTVSLRASAIAAPLRNVWIDLDVLLGTDLLQAHMHWAQQLAADAQSEELPADLADVIVGRRSMVQAFVQEIASAVDRVLILSRVSEASTRHLLQQWGDDLAALGVITAAQLRDQLAADVSGSSPAERATFVGSFSPALLNAVKKRGFHTVEAAASPSAPLATQGLGAYLQAHNAACAWAA